MFLQIVTNDLPTQRLPQHSNATGVSYESFHYVDAQIAMMIDFVMTLLLSRLISWICVPVSTPFVFAAQAPVSTPWILV